MIFLVYQSPFKKEMWCTSGFVKHALALFTEQICCLQLENGFDEGRISAKGNKNTKMFHTFENLVNSVVRKRQSDTKKR